MKWIYCHKGNRSFFYIKILVSEQGNMVCEKTAELSQFVDYEERQKGLS